MIGTQVLLDIVYFDGGTWGYESSLRFLVHVDRRWEVLVVTFPWCHDLGVSRARQ